MQLSAAITVSLLRRALHRPVRAEYAAVAWPRSQDRVAARALVEELARIRRHSLKLNVPALGTGQCGLKNKVAHGSLDDHGLRRTMAIMSIYWEPRSQLRNRRWQCDII